MKKSAKRTRRVDDIDSKLFQFSRGRRLLVPVAKRHCALCGDALLAPQFHAIHLGNRSPSPVLHLSASDNKKKVISRIRPV